MKLKTRLATAFLTITIVPLALIFMAIIGLSSYQAQSFRKAYGLNETVELLSGNSMQIFNRLTQKTQAEIRAILKVSPEKFEDQAYLEQLNQKLQSHYAYLIVRKGEDLIFIGDENQTDEEKLHEVLPEYAILNAEVAGGIYLDGDTQHLIKQIDFRFPDESSGSVFIVSRVDYLVPEAKSMIIEMFVAGVSILVVAGMLLTMWIYRSILMPLNKLQEATKQIRDGNLDFALEVEDEDEIGQLCQDFEEMRIRLKESGEEKVEYDRESKELISNIAHDLKTPITAIKGYAEGIMDGVASSPERLDKYIRTIYNKANDMDRLIDELTFYSKIDTNKIPYTFSKINVAQYFKDCTDEVGLDMDSKGIELGYFNYVDDDVMVIADAEQMKRVVNNIIGNSVKYLDKKKGIINIRIKDVGDFIEVEIEDNGRGIAVKDLPNIFDRFYRADSSRNSSKGGSGIGLSIVRKIIEDHGGRIWATSKEGIGTEIHFVLRKYQEVIQE
ncbi:MAG: HAMP domain-containing sensor histidine kinase [Lachnospiraceae bacterium]|nr:HAMP domain-containing sensor histidine kinase [Lachnospiraceae bacterium]